MKTKERERQEDWAIGRVLEKKDAEISRLKDQIADAETALRIWDEGGNSEYWLRHPDK